MWGPFFILVAYLTCKIVLVCGEQEEYADITKVVRVIDTTTFGVESIIVTNCFKSVISVVKIADLCTKYN